MKDTEHRTFHVLQAIREFVRAHPIASPPPLYAATMQGLDDQITDLETKAADQNSGLASARKATRSRTSLLNTLRTKHMVPLRTLGKALLGDIAGIDQQFMIPPVGVGRDTLLAAARAMIQHAAPYEELLVAHGRPVDFIARMQALIDRVNATTENHVTNLRRRNGATTGVKLTITRAKKTVKFLDVMIREAYADDLQAIAEWQSAKRFFPRAVVTAPVQGPDAVTGVTPDTGSGGAGTPVATTDTGAPSTTPVGEAADQAPAGAVSQAA